jgi:glycosyltransferase involved in cell wall biosynthesis
MKFLPKNYLLKLAGPTIDEKYLTSLKDYCRKNKLDNVEFLGKVPYLEVAKFLLETILFVSASKMEVQSLAVIEALASGTPIVGISNETIDELVNEENGFVFSKNTSPKKFAEKIEEICSLPRDEYIKLSGSARRRVEELDWGEIVAKTAGKYKEVIGSKKELESENCQNIFSKDFKLETEFFNRLKINKEGYNNDLNIILLAVATLLANNFYALFEEVNNFLKKFKD